MQSRASGSSTSAKPAAGSIFQNSALFKGLGDNKQWTISNDNYKLLRDAIMDLLDLDLNHYRTQQMERRLTTLLERRHANSWQAYVANLRRDPVELEYFQEFITINVSSFYRDADKWDFLRTKILPELLAARPMQGISGWSVGCSIGAEVYTLAMLLMEQAPTRRHALWATDIDARVLERAKAGGPYFQNELRELPNQLVQLGMNPVSNQLLTMKPNLKSIVDFGKFNLLKDETTRKFDLVMCRNVVIYFTPEVKPQVYQRMARGMRPGGVLFIGSTETIANYQQLGFDYIAPSFYRYVG
ncbi:MAG: protein-glutamate O-methyltransferase CheR [Caldilineaceae bacterium]